MTRSAFAGLLCSVILHAPLGAQEAGQTDIAADTTGLTDPASAALDSKAADIAAMLRCPVCRGQSVVESNSGIAQEMQSVIRERLGEGETEEEILEYFVAAYGDWIILKPRAIGLNLLVYILPSAALILGGVWLVTRIRKWSKDSPPADDGQASGLSEDDDQWLREAIGRG